MRISRRGLYALKALCHLAERHEGGVVRVADIAAAEGIPEKFLEGILVFLKNARIVSSRRGREGGYALRRAPDAILLGEVIRLVDGPLAPFGDLEELTRRVKTERRQAGLFEVFLEVRNAAAAILDHTTLSDVLARNRRLSGASRRRAAR
ncbi:MAG TPA: Rrf2 family transcriptional regulator [Thermoanaerobaculia bacterium]|nr:Rrf2 family transcriptional regulator [Thermoanaerobaculia bacterium]HQR68798.1 Rrf2 family transcriptional regulator [Thermoanaerobaculia bacterium]